jgi:hypothetical protein
LQRRTTVFDTEEEELIRNHRKKIVNILLFQMQTFIIFLLILTSGVVSGVVENLLRLREFIIDIYQQFPHGCIFIIDPESQQQGEG